MRAEAHCGNSESGHAAAPEWSCRCGFYGLKLPREDDPWPTAWRLDVWLWGRVIEHPLGYRAEHQQVTRVTAPRVCVGPAAGDATIQPCGAAALYLAVGTSGGLFGYCNEHAPREGIVAPEEVSARLGVPVDAPGYLPERRPPDIAWSLAEIAEALKGGVGGLGELPPIPREVKELVQTGVRALLQIPSTNPACPWGLEFTTYSDGWYLRLRDCAGTPVWQVRVPYARTADPRFR